MKIIKAGLIYFLIVFGAGFILGPVRLWWAVPRFGVRTAELMEAPIMIAVVIFAARWVVRRFCFPPTPGSRLAVGIIGLALMLGAEFSFVLKLRGLSISEYFATRDPVSGTVYFLSLALFAIMPLLVERK